MQTINISTNKIAKQFEFKKLEAFFVFAVPKGFKIVEI